MADRSGATAHLANQFEMAAANAKPIPINDNTNNERLGTTMSKIALLGGMLDAFSRKLLSRFRLDHEDSPIILPNKPDPLRERMIRWFESKSQAHGPVMMPASGWEAGSRQVQRAAMRTIAFAQVTKDYWNGRGMRTISRRRARQLARMRAALNYNIARA